MNEEINKKALAYHASFPSGKLKIAPTKPLDSLEDLALAYSPGVAAPCRAIVAEAAAVYTYTTKGNLVAVITNGTALLGLGNVSPEAAKPVMEGKVILLRQLAGVNAFDLEIAEKDPERLIAIITALAPTFGGINLEDIKAPDCFKIEKALQQALAIPVMHDDQHSTAIVMAAALKNALLFVKKAISSIRIVIHGAGAGAIASATLLHTMGVPKEHIVLFDSQGIIHVNRTQLSPQKVAFATTQHHATLGDALAGTDFFLGLSVGNVMTAKDLLRMAPNPIVFALANPEPEIDYALAQATRSDLIIGTGRSDYPNQVNNVLAFPYIFRGLLDMRATQLNEAIKLAAVEAIAAIVHQVHPNNGAASFGRDYLLPNPLDRRLFASVPLAVAKAAVNSGVGRNPFYSWKAYQQYLLSIQRPSTP